ncbi:MAG: hypothetical protein ACP5XB_21960 [Isosphaeraceae bacterium]
MRPDTLPADAEDPAVAANLEEIPDSRISAFCSGELLDLFHAFAYSSDVWKADPFDVESIHAEARKWFDRALNRVLEPSGLASGRILLLLGESGSGKTHLMRAFRGRVHSQHRGYCGYMQMTAFTGQYGRYVLNNLIESLDKPYHELESPESGLMRISNALARLLNDSGQADLQRLREGGLDQTTIDQNVVALADQVVLDDRFREVDVFLIQALFYLQCGDPRIKARVLMYLRCEDLTSADRRLLGGIIPRTYADAPHWMIQRLGQLIWAVERVPLILCVDQLEDVFDLEEAAIKFRKAMATLCDVVSRLPSAIVVISCLENFYDELKRLLTRPVKDRVENDPRPVSLHTPCSRDEVERLIGLRLKHLFASRGAAFHEEEPTFPLPEELVRALVGLRARDVLLECQLYRDRCIEEGKMARYPFEDDGDGQRVLETERAISAIEQAWNDFRATFSPIIPSDEAELAEILSRAIRACADELPAEQGYRAKAEGRFILIEPPGSLDGGVRSLAAICNKAPQGGWLSGQVKELLKQAGEQSAVAVAVRSMDFPSNPRTAIFQLLHEFVDGGGRQVVVEDSDWRTMMAMARFLDEHARAHALADWRKRTRPLASLSSLRQVLQLEAIHDRPTHHQSP